MKVKCISSRLNHIVFGKDGNGVVKPHRVQVGETFDVKSIPASWAGLVSAVDGGSTAADADADADADGDGNGDGNGDGDGDGKIAVTNPADTELESLKAQYKEATGNAAHYSWNAEKIQEKLDELAAS